MVMGLLSMEIVLGLHCNNHQKLKVGLRIAFLLDFPAKIIHIHIKRALRLKSNTISINCNCFF